MKTISRLQFMRMLRLRGIVLAEADPWMPLVSTNVSAMPFDYVDFDVKIAEKHERFYRVRQP